MSARRLTIVPVLAAALVIAPAMVTDAHAQGVGIRGLVSFGAVQMTAKDSFDAVFGTSTINEIGGGVQVTNLWRGVFAEVSGGRSKETGERVFVHDGTVFPLGISLEATLTPLDIVGGYRFNRGGRIVPFVGGGYTSMAYQETSPFAIAGDDVDERYGGFVALGGVEVRTFNWLHVRVRRATASARRARCRRRVVGLWRGFAGGLRLGIAVMVGR